MWSVTVGDFIKSYVNVHVDLHALHVHVHVQCTFTCMPIARRSMTTQTHMTLSAQAIAIETLILIVLLKHHTLGHSWAEVEQEAWSVYSQGRREGERQQRELLALTRTAPSSHPSWRGQTSRGEGVSS